MRLLSFKWTQKKHSTRIDQPTYFNFYNYNNSTIKQNACGYVTQSHTMHCRFRLSPNDTHLYLNTFPFQSLPGVDFLVFHPRDLTPFLIRLTWTFNFHYYLIFLSFSISCTFLNFYFSFTQPWFIRNAIRLIILNHKYHKYHIKFPWIQISIKLQFIPWFHCFSKIPIIPTIKYNYFSIIKLPKTTK